MCRVCQFVVVVIIGWLSLLSLPLFVGKSFIIISGRLGSGRFYQLHSSNEHHTRISFRATYGGCVFQKIHPQKLIEGVYELVISLECVHLWFLPRKMCMACNIHSIDGLPPQKTLASIKLEQLYPQVYYHHQLFLVCFDKLHIVRTGRCNYLNDDFNGLQNCTTVIVMR